MGGMEEHQKSWRKDCQRTSVVDFEAFPDSVGEYDPERCAAVTQSHDAGNYGRQCGNHLQPGERYCWVHGGKSKRDMGLPDRERSSFKGLRLEQVEAAGRDAEWGRGVMRIRFYDDGAAGIIVAIPMYGVMWKRQVVTIPPTGWRHADDCDCEFCLP